jgi:hypothetical protein
MFEQEPQRRGYSAPRVHDALVSVFRAVERSLKLSQGTERVKDEVRALCIEARRTGTPVESLIVDLHEMLDRDDRQWSSPGSPGVRLRHALISYLILAYYRADQ